MNSKSVLLCVFFTLGLVWAPVFADEVSKNLENVKKEYYVKGNADALLRGGAQSRWYLPIINGLNQAANADPNLKAESFAQMGIIALQELEKLDARRTGAFVPYFRAVDSAGNALEGALAVVPALTGPVSKIFVDSIGKGLINYGKDLIRDNMAISSRAAATLEMTEILYSHQGFGKSAEAVLTESYDSKNQDLRTAVDGLLKPVTDIGMRDDVVGILQNKAGDESKELSETKVLALEKIKNPNSKELAERLERAVKNVITQKLKDIQEEISKANEKAQKQELEKLTTETEARAERNAVFLTSSLLKYALGPENAQAVQAFSTLSFGVLDVQAHVSNYRDTIAKNADLKSAATINLSADLVSTAMNIVTSLMGIPSMNEVILKELTQLRKEVASMHEDMLAHFEALDQTLLNMRLEIAQQFGKISDQVQKQSDLVWALHQDSMVQFFDLRLQIDRLFDEVRVVRTELNAKLDVIVKLESGITKALVHIEDDADLGIPLTKEVLVKDLEAIRLYLKGQTEKEVDQETEKTVKKPLDSNQWIYLTRLTLRLLAKAKDIQDFPNDYAKFLMNKLNVEGIRISNSLKDSTGFSDSLQDLRNNRKVVFDGLLTQVKARLSEFQLSFLSLQSDFLKTYIGRDLPQVEVLKPGESTDSRPFANITNFDHTGDPQLDFDLEHKGETLKTSYIPVSIQNAIKYGLPSCQQPQDQTAMIQGFLPSDFHRIIPASYRTAEALGLGDLQICYQQGVVGNLAKLVKIDTHNTGLNLHEAFVLGKDKTDIFFSTEEWNGSATIHGQILKRDALSNALAKKNKSLGKKVFASYGIEPQIPVGFLEYEEFGFQFKYKILVHFVSKVKSLDSHVVTNIVIQNNASKKGLIRTYWSKGLGLYLQTLDPEVLPAQVALEFHQRTLKNHVAIFQKLMGKDILGFNQSQWPDYVKAFESGNLQSKAGTYASSLLGDIAVSFMLMPNQDVLDKVLLLRNKAVLGFEQRMTTRLCDSWKKLDQNLSSELRVDQAIANLDRASHTFITLLGREYAAALDRQPTLKTFLSLSVPTEQSIKSVIGCSNQKEGPNPRRLNLLLDPKANPATGHSQSIMEARLELLSGLLSDSIDQSQMDETPLEIQDMRQAIQFILYELDKGIPLKDLFSDK